MDFKFFLLDRLTDIASPLHKVHTLPYMDTLPEGDIGAERYPHCFQCSQKPRMSKTRPVTLVVLAFVHMFISEVLYGAGVSLK